MSDVWMFANKYGVAAALPLSGQHHTLNLEFWHGACQNALLGVKEGTKTLKAASSVSHPVALFFGSCCAGSLEGQEILETRS